MSLCTLLFSQRIWHSINLWGDHWRWILQTCCSSFISTSDQSSHLREDHCGRVLALNLANIFALLLWTAATLCTTSGLSWSSLRFTSIIFHEHTSLQFWLDLFFLYLALNPNLLAKAFTTAVTPQTGFAGLQVLKQLPRGSCSHSGVRPAHARCHSTIWNGTWESKWEGKVSEGAFQKHNIVKPSCSEHWAGKRE